jgi:hypothetical protein
MGWIKATVDCSVGNVLAALREQVASGFSRWEELKLATSTRKVQFNRLEPVALMITKELNRSESDWARVGILNGAIVIARKESPGKVEEVHMLPSFNVSGACRLRYNDKDLELWEVSRLFLERFLL